MGDDELRFAGVVAQVAALRAGTVTSMDLVRDYLGHIDRLDPQLNAFRLVFGARALKEAADADARRARGEDAPLLGVPIVVKEDADLAGLPTTNGTDAVERVAEHDAEVVARARRAGAVVLGRTRAPELCIWPWTESEFAGPTRNPVSPLHSPGGSSGGAAAAVAAGLAAGAIGSDGGGSIRLPAAATGLFGLKPQRGRISLWPHPQVWTGLSVYGPITPTVADAALLLDVLAGPVPGDAHVSRTPETTFTEALTRPVGRLRVAVSTRSWPPGTPLHPAVRDALLGATRRLADHGHTVRRRDPPLVDPTAFGSFVPRYLHSIADTAARLDRPEKLSRSVRSAAAMGRLYSPGVVEASIRYADRVARRVNSVFDHADVLLAPMTPRPPLRVGELSGRWWLAALLGAQRFASYATVWNVVGNPAASVPFGRTREGLPVAVQVIGRPDDEATVLRVSQSLLGT